MTFPEMLDDPNQKYSRLSESIRKTVEGQREAAKSFYAEPSDPIKDSVKMTAKDFIPGMDPERMFDPFYKFRVKTGIEPIVTGFLDAIESTPGNLSARLEQGIEALSIRPDEATMASSSLKKIVTANPLHRTWELIQGKIIAPLMEKTDVDEKIAGFAGAAADKFYEAAYRGSERDMNKFGYHFGSGLGSVATAFALHSIGASTAATAGFMTLLEGGQVYHSMRKNGVDITKAQAVTMAHDIATFTLERYGLEMLFKQHGSVLKNLVLRSVANAQEEFAQDVSQQSILEAFGVADKTTLLEKIESGAMSALIGFLVGGTTSLASDAAMRGMGRIGIEGRADRALAKTLSGHIKNGIADLVDVINKNSLVPGLHVQEVPSIHLFNRHPQSVVNKLIDRMPDQATAIPNWLSKHGVPSNDQAWLGLSEWVKANKRSDGTIDKDLFSAYVESTRTGFQDDPNMKSDDVKVEVQGYGTPGTIYKAHKFMLNIPANLMPEETAKLMPGRASTKMRVTLTERMTDDGKAILVVDNIESPLHYQAMYEEHKTHPDRFRDLARDVAAVQEQYDKDRANMAAIGINNAVMHYAESEAGKAAKFDINDRRAFYDKAAEIMPHYSELIQRAADGEKTLNSIAESGIDQVGVFNNVVHQVVMNRVTRYAAERGFDYVGWANPSNLQSAGIRGMEKITELRWSKNGNVVTLDPHRFVRERGQLEPVKVRGFKQTVIDPNHPAASPESPEYIGIEDPNKLRNLRDVVGKHLGDVIQNSKNQSGVIKGLDVIVGDSFAANMFGIKIPDYMMGFGKEFGIKTNPVELEGGALIGALQINRKMMEDVQKLDSVVSRGRVEEKALRDAMEAVDSEVSGIFDTVDNQTRIKLNKNERLDLVRLIAERGGLPEIPEARSEMIKLTALMVKRGSKWRDPSAPANVMNQLNSMRDALMNLEMRTGKTGIAKKGLDILSETAVYYHSIAKSLQGMMERAGINPEKIVETEGAEERIKQYLFRASPEEKSMLWKGMSDDERKTAAVFEREFQHETATALRFSRWVLWRTASRDMIDQYKKLSTPPALKASLYVGPTTRLATGYHFTNDKKIAARDPQMGNVPRKRTIEMSNPFIFDRFAEFDPIMRKAGEKIDRTGLTDKQFVYHRSQMVTKILREDYKYDGFAKRDANGEIEYAVVFNKPDVARKNRRLGHLEERLKSYLPPDATIEDMELVDQIYEASLAENPATAEEQVMKHLATQKWGTRAHYYMSDTDFENLTDSMVNTLMKMVSPSENVLGGEKQVQTVAKTPGEGKTRKSRRNKADEGPLFPRAFGHIARVKMMAMMSMRISEFASDLEDVKDNLSKRDLQSLRHMVKNAMGFGEEITGATLFFEKFNQFFWLTYPLAFNRAARYTARNLLQNAVLGPSQMNPLRFIESGLKIITEGRSESLKKIMSDGYFAARISQKMPMFNQFMMALSESSDAADVLNRRIAKWTKFAATVIPFSDEINRMICFPGAYTHAETQLKNYRDGKINYKQLSNRLKIKTMHPIQQMEFHQLIDKSALEETAFRFAEIVTENVHFKYRTSERSPLEQSRAARPLVGLINWPRSAFETLYRNGLKPLAIGWETKDVGRAFAGMRTCINYLAGFVVGEKIGEKLIGKPFKGFYYNILNTFTSYTPGSAGFSLATQILEEAGAVVEELSKGNVDGAMSVIGNRFAYFVPLMTDIVNAYEVANDVQGATAAGVVKDWVFGHYKSGRAAKRDGVVKWYNLLFSEKGHHLLFGTDESRSSEKGRKEWRKYNREIRRGRRKRGNQPVSRPPVQGRQQSPSQRHQEINTGNREWMEALKKIRDLSGR